MRLLTPNYNQKVFSLHAEKVVEARGKLDSSGRHSFTRKRGHFEIYFGSFLSSSKADIFSRIEIYEVELEIKTSLRILYFRIR